MIRNPAALSKRRIVRIVRKFVYTGNFPALQTKNFLWNKNGQSSPKPMSTNLRTIRTIQSKFFVWLLHQTLQGSCK